MLFISISISYADSEPVELSPPGWHWYNDLVDQDTDDAELTDPLDQMNAENKATLRALYTARKKPTKENVKNYIQMQQQVVAESKAFSHVWQAVLLENPQLDYSIKHPTNNFAKMIASDQESKKEEEVIHALAK